MCTPCNEIDMDLFCATTIITVGNGKISHFWDSPWLNGRTPKDIAPLIYEASSMQKWKINQVLQNNAWVSKIKKDTNLIVTYIHQYVRLN
jgi:hypothetical protein